MSHNLNPPESPDFALPALAIVSVEGPDASRFLHAQSMNDVADLSVMDWHLDGWLTPQGRLVALFTVIKLSAEHLLLVTPSSGVTELVAGLQRFVFRSKVKLSTMTGATVAGATADLPAGTRVQVSSDVVRVRWPGEARSMCLHLTGPTAPVDAMQATHWMRQDMRLGIPWIGADATPAWTPQQLSLERWPAFSVKKGCYPGQEIVARTHFLGKGKRQLHRIQWATDPGDCTESAIVQRFGTEALCVLPIDAKDHPDLMCGVAFDVLPFDPR
jgi:folate-binding protein YgfZ